MTDSDEIRVLPSGEIDAEHDYEDVPYEDIGEMSPEEPSSKRHFLWMLILIVGVIIGFAVAFTINWFVRPAPYDSSALDAQLSELQAEVIALQNRPEPVIPTINLAPLRNRIAALEARPTVDPLSEEIVSRMENLQAEGFELPVMPDLPDFEANEARMKALEDQISAQTLAISALQMGSGVDPVPAAELFVDPDTLPRFPAQTLREGAAELGGSGFVRRTFSRHVRVRGSNAPDVLISGIEDDLENGKPRAALAKFDRLPPQLRSLARAWRANMEEAL